MASFRSIAKKTGRFVTGKERERPPESRFWGDLGATGPDDPNLLDPTTGMPRRQPAQEIAPQVQHAADIWTRRYNIQQQQAATGTLQNALESISSYRPGGAAARASGLYGQLAQTHMQRQLDSPYLLYQKDLEQQRLARKAQTKAGYMGIAGQVLGAAIGGLASGMGGGAPAPGGLGPAMQGAAGGLAGGAYGQQQGQQILPDATVIRRVQQPGPGGPQGAPMPGQGGMPMAAAYQAGQPQGDGGGFVGAEQAQAAVGRGGQVGPQAGQPTPGPAGPRPQQEGQGQPGAPGQPGAEAQAMPAGPPPRIVPSFDRTATAYGVDPYMVSLMAMEIDPRLDPSGWLDELASSLDTMLAEDGIESPFAGMLA